MKMKNKEKSNRKKSSKRRQSRQPIPSYAPQYPREETIKQGFQQNQQYPQNLLLNSPTGIKELDNSLSGGFPKGAVVLLAGSSGSGKTILSLQWLFEGVRNNENGVYVTVTEPLFDIIKNLEGMKFYDRSFVEDERLKIVDIRDIYEKKGFDPAKVLSVIEEQVKSANAKRLCIDSITSIAYSLNDKALIRQFIFELGKILKVLGCTTILTGEVTEKDRFSVYGVEEFISDAILVLDNIEERNRHQRRIQIIKVRGRSHKSEDIYFKITGNGIEVFPDFVPALEYSSTTERLSTGVELLDKMLFGGLFKGSSTLVSGSTGTGKTLAGMQFIADGLKKGENCLYSSFEESREQLIRNAKSFGWDLEEYEKKGLLTLRSVYPGKKLLEEHFADIQKIVEEKQIKRCAVDSLSAISHSFPEDIFLNFTHRLNDYLKMHNVTTIFTTATGALVGTTTLAESHLSTMTDNILLLRYVEIEGELMRVMNIVKVRGSAHSKGLRQYDITGKGLVIGTSLSGYEGILTGVTRKVSETVEEQLSSEFKNFLGPMAKQIFAGIKEQGLTKENIFSYIDELTNQGIVKKEDAEPFRQSISSIISSKSEEYSRDAKISAGDLKTLLKPEQQSNKAQEKEKGIFKKVFG